MRVALQILFVFLILTGGCAVGPFGPEIDTRLQHLAKITFKVLDDNGNPIPKSEIFVSTFSHWKPGDNFGSDVDKEAHGITDTNGKCSLELAGKTGEYAYGVKPPAGYYYGGTASYTFSNNAVAVWMPWNPTIEIVLQKKGVQVPMYARHVFENKIPVEGKPVGFDLMAGDWVAPYGKGETSDFLLDLESKPEPPVSPREIPPYDVTWTVKFSNDGDGIQSATPLSHGFRVAREAPTDGYKPELIKHSYKERGQPDHFDFNEDQNYFFRVRTEKDAQGKIINALYGKISGDFRGGSSGKLTFTYYLNPEPNSRNMEFDPKQNLSKNLKFMEGVRGP